MRLGTWCIRLQDMDKSALLYFQLYRDVVHAVVHLSPLLILCREAQSTRAPIDFQDASGWGRDSPGSQIYLVKR